jgi:hypothetical protein
MEFDRRPSATAFMLKALLPSPGLHKSGSFPSITARWHNHRVDRQRLLELVQLTGLRAATYLPMIYPHVFGFRLQMVVLTHPAFPLPVWGALQIRNHLLQYRPIPLDSAMDLETRVADHRILEKGAEVDLHTTVNVGAKRMWASLNTFYYRGQFGERGTASPLSNSPATPTTTVAQWRLPSGVGSLRFARMTGDYNGIHQSGWYARLLGFRQAFYHPQMLIGQCMAHLDAPDRSHPQRLDLWLKGPVYFNSEVTLYACGRRGVTEFALIVQGDERPAILGRWSAAEHDEPMRAVGLGLD